MKNKLENNENPEVRWLIDKVYKIAEAMRLGIFEFQFTISNENKESYRSDHDILLMISPLREYRRAEIIISPIAIKMIKEKKDIDYLIDAIVHELCHIPVSLVGDKASKRYISEGELRESVEELTETMATYVRENLKLKTTIYKHNLLDKLKTKIYNIKTINY